MDVMMVNGKAPEVSHAEAPPQQESLQAEVRSRCLNEIYPYLVRRIGCVEDAEDLTAEVYGTALRQARRPNELKSWLFGIARRKLADAMRKRPKRQVPLASLD